MVAKVINMREFQLRKIVPNCMSKEQWHRAIDDAMKPAQELMQSYFARDMPRTVFTTIRRYDQGGVK